MENASFRDLTKKTLFLISLATARRVGELQALSHKVSWFGEDACVSYISSFIAKTESVDNQLPRSFIIKSLCEFVGDLEQERLLCPVRALKFYLKASSTIIGRPLNLFVSPRCRQRAISKNALSYFLRETISGAGALCPSEGHGLRAHSIRGVSTSFNFHRNCAVSEISKSATWRSNIVFASFYLRDYTYSLDDLYSLGPFVSAGRVLNNIT